MLLFLALAILFAGASALWPMKPIADKTSDSARAPVAATILLLAAQLNDSAPFIILAAAAWTGDPILAAVGGAVGLIAAVMGGLALPPTTGIGRVRIAIGIALLLLGGWMAVSALGLV
jgi:Ca2+/H+ antiporter, TMEM165/GDT1 family